MTVTLAPEAQDLLAKAGGKWPDADEDHILDMADSWKGFGRRVGQVRTEADHSVQSITGGNFGDDIEAFAKWWLENADKALETLETVATSVDSVLASIAKAVLDAKKAILDVLEWAAEAIKKAEDAAGDIPVIGGLVKDALEDVLEPIFNAIRDAVEDIVNGLADAILTVVNDVLRTLIGLLKDAIDAFRKLIKAAERKLNHNGEETKRRVRASIGNPTTFDPQSVKGMDPKDLADCIPNNWPSAPSRSGGGTVYSDPNNPGRQIRIMPGYPAGSRPDPVTHGPYAMISQNGTKTKVPLAGNPTLPGGK